MKNIIVFAVLCFFTGAMNGNAQDNVEKSTKPVKKDYRIEVEKDQNGQPKAFKFKSPDDKVIKTINYSTRDEQRKITLSPDNTYLIEREEKVVSVDAKPSGFSRNEQHAKIAYIDASGKRVWEKEFVVDSPLTQSDNGPEPYFVKISKDGDKIAFVRTHKYGTLDSSTDLAVLDRNGQQIAFTERIPRLMEGSSSDLEMSPDGSIIGAIVYTRSGTQSEKNLFFLDVASGNTKIVKAEGVMRGKKWKASFYFNPQIKNKVSINIWFSRNLKERKSKGWSKYLRFSEIPENLSHVLPDPS